MSIQSSINQAVNGMMSMIMPMSLLKEQGKVKQIKAEQEALKKSNEELKTSNDELKTSNEDLKKRNEEEIKLWNDILDNAPYSQEKYPGSSFVDYILSNPYSAANGTAGTMATQRVQAEQERRNAQMKRLQEAFKSIGMGGDNNG